MSNEDHDVLIAVKTTLDSIYERLFGHNGDPGEIKSLRDRSTSLEAFKNKMMGALLILGSSTFITVVILFWHLSTGK